MKIEEREKDLRAQEIIEKFVDEFYKVLNEEKSVLNPITTCLDYGRTNREFRVRGPKAYEAANERLAKKSGIMENDQVIADNMIMELHTFLRANTPKYEAGDNFPKLIIQFQEKSKFGYSDKSKTIYILLGEEYRKIYRQYLNELTYLLNPVGTFYAFLANTLYNGDTPAPVIAHEFSHMLDDLTEFDMGYSKTKFSADDEYGESEEEQERKRKDIKAYFNDPIELEAYLREEIFSYYRETVGLFQYIAQGILEGGDVNYLISDIINDIIEEYKGGEYFGLSRWEWLTEKNRTRTIKRIYSAVETLLTREVEKLENN